ncbi:MAG: N-6 DNA methylase [Armatimonadetes bacterium]|nr:N-6 DNA methylase [Armatimonadota bacterium]
MAIKKSDLYSSLWASCDQLRGGMDASQYKDYVLFMLFIKYVSDKYADSKEFRPAVVIPQGASFKDMIAMKGRSDIGDRINKQVIQPLIDANNLLARTDFPNFNDPSKLGDGKEMVDKLTNLIGIFQNPALDFSKNRAENDDILGDAYEYLMRHFATESGKSKGQFYTPAEVSRVVAKVIGIGPQNSKASTTAYDPTCGSGSLLLKVAAEAGKAITLEGQEKDVSTAGLARMNMILHNFPTAIVQTGNTLAAPKFRDKNDQLKTYDYVVANPPFSDKSWSTGLIPASDPFQRFAWGEPPTKQGDYAYLLHIIRSMNSTGKAACILPHGVLFRGNAEAAIRKRLVKSGILKGIIGLPPNLFYGTGIPACILVMDQENAQARKGIFMIDAAKGFIKDGPKNRLREQDIHLIVDTFTKLADVPGYARMVPHQEISDPKNDFNLNLPRYIDSTEPEDLHDINAHLQGGIPNRDIDALGDYWQVLPSVRTALLKRAGRAGYSALRLPIADVKPTILDHPEFATFNAQVLALFNKWKKQAKPLLQQFGQDIHPKALIATLAESLLHTFAAAPLIDPYDIYQHLMDYWEQTMQDDCYLIAADGWTESARPRVMADDKKNKTKEKPDLLQGRKKFRTELIQPALLVARYFQAEQRKIEHLEGTIATLSQQMEEIAEEHTGDDGLLADALNDKGKLTKPSAAARLKEIKRDPDAADERKILSEWIALAEQWATETAQLKTKQDALATALLAKYPQPKEEAERLIARQSANQLTEPEIITLVVEDKWLATIAAALQSELDRVSQTLTGRVRQLAERYADPLPQLASNVKVLTAKVERHLKKMGAEV